MIYECKITIYSQIEEVLWWKVLCCLPNALFVNWCYPLVL